nr:Uncharacterised protein [Citrobacter werkmanii]
MVGINSVLSLIDIDDKSDVLLILKGIISIEFIYYTKPEGYSN